MITKNAKIAAVGITAAFLGAMVLVIGIVRSTVPVNHPLDGYDYGVMHSSLWIAVLILLAARALLGLLPHRRRQ